MVLSFMRLYLGVELVVAEVERGVDGLEGLKVNVHFLLLAVLRQHSTAVQHKPVVRNY